MRDPILWCPMICCLSYFGLHCFGVVDERTSAPHQTPLDAIADVHGNMARAFHQTSVVFTGRIAFLFGMHPITF